VKLTGRFRNQDWVATWAIRRWRCRGQQRTQPVAAVAGSAGRHRRGRQPACMTALSCTSCSGHQVRAGAANNHPYDLLLPGVAAVVLLAGFHLLRVTGSPRAGPS